MTKDNPVNTTIKSYSQVTVEQPMNTSTYCILLKANFKKQKNKKKNKSKFYMSWGYALNNVPCQGQVSILRSILPTHKHFHLNAMSSMSWHLSYWLHFNKETIWRIYSLLSLNQARVILFFYPSYYVFLAMELKLHFTFPVQEILQDPPHYRQGFKRQIRGKYVHKWASHRSNSWVRKD